MVNYELNSAGGVGCFGVIFYAICPLETINCKIITKVFCTGGNCVRLRRYLVIRFSHILQKILGQVVPLGGWLVVLCVIFIMENCRPFKMGVF